MEQGPTYTIAIPAFKGKYLHDCIASILAQSMADFELIVVDDCSPDDIRGIVEAFPAGSIRYYRNETNTGARNVVDNWNKCLSLATGRFFVLMGDDDMMEPNYLAEFSKLIAQYPDLDVYHCRCKVMDDRGFVQSSTPICPPLEQVYEYMYHRLDMRRIQYVSDFVYRREALNREGGFFKLPLAWGSDDITAFRACGKKGIAYTAGEVFKYRQSSITITASGNVEQKMEAVEGQRAWLSNFLADEPSEVGQQKFYHKLIENFDAFILRKRADIVKQDIKRGGFPCFAAWMFKASRYRVPGLLVLKIYLLSKVRKS